MPKNDSMQLPGKKTAIILTIVFLLSNFIFIVTMLGSMPMLQDTIHIKNLSAITTYFNRNIFYFDLVAGIVQAITILSIMSMFPTTGFPSLLSYIAATQNFIICSLFSLFLYFVDLRNTPFTLQIILVIPIVIIFLSSVFLIDDTADLIRDKYVIYLSRKKRSQLSARRLLEDIATRSAEHDTSLEADETMSREDKMNQYLEGQRDRVAKAALKTIPTLDEDKVIK